MLQAERKEVLKSVQKGEPFATGYQLLYRGVLKPFKVWEIPMEALIYNQYNGRIGSVVKSYEKQSHTLNPELDSDITLIETFLWESKKEANKNTLDSLRKTGQIKFGIVSSDGVIIDGNRRASLMKSSKILIQFRRRRTDVNFLKLLYSLRVQLKRTSFS